MNTSPFSPGRGASMNPGNRFETLEFVREPDDSCHDEEEPLLRTTLLRDETRSILTRNESPDVGFTFSINPYRGCEHGCAYCFARPTHEYLGFSSGLDFESKIVVKMRAPELLREELSSPRWQPQVLAMSGVTDCYQPVERRLELTRGCLAVLAEFRNPLGVITKNHLIVRDIDLYRELAKFEAVSVSISITSLDPELAKRLEPRASPPSRRLAAIHELSSAGIPVNVMFAPSIPGLNDHEMLPVLAAASKAGACGAGFVPLRLPYAVKEIFAAWLERHFPDRKEKVLGRVRDMREGKMNDSRFGSRMHGSGVYAEQMRAMFDLACRKAAFRPAPYQLSTANFRAPGEQLKLF